MFLVLVAAGVLTSGAACDGAGEPAPSATPPTPSATLPSPAVRAADGGAVRVAESGYSLIKDSRDRELITYGIVVENTSTAQVAVQTRLTIRLTDAAGKQIKDKLMEPPADMVRELSAVFPGQRLGIGTQTYLDRTGVTKMTIEVGPSYWVALADKDTHNLHRLVARDVVTNRHPGGPKAEIRFSVLSEFPGTINQPSAQAVFRDAAGKVVGGTLYVDTRAGSRYPPGRSTGYIDVQYGIPASADDSKTEVYVSPFCCR